MPRPPAAFLSYRHFDDDHDEGRITQLRKRLEGEVRLHLGEEFPIFQDRTGLRWGDEWKARIADALDGVTFFIPVLTPGFFTSAPCRQELETFLAREERAGRRDLLLPVYYVDATTLNDPVRREAEPLARILFGRQYEDWRDLRFEPLSGPVVGRRLARMAVQIRDAFERAPRLSPRPASTFHGVSGAAMAAEPTIGGNSVAPFVLDRKDPLTYVVDAVHRGDFATISAAIEAAKPGDRILVRPGLYEESLAIEKPLEVIGDGPAEEIVVQAQGDRVLSFRTSMGLVAGLTLRQMGGGKLYGIDIAQGRLDLEDCDITSQGLACVAIHGGADPRLRRNRIHDGSASGVFVYEDGQGTLEDNDISGHALAGVEIKTGGNPVLRRNRIHDGRAGGVFVNRNGRGLLEDNEISGNALAGIGIRTGGNPVLRRNRIQGGKASGVLVSKGGEGLLEDNDILGNALAGVAIRTMGRPLLRRNRILGNGHHGLWIYRQGGGIFEDNDLRDNSPGPWLVEPDCEDRVKRRGNLE